jgi:hypothetical protein
VALTFVYGRRSQVRGGAGKSDSEAVESGLKEKAREFVEKGAEVYAKT